jgi:peptidoglycan/xylan/chitin deacetylase (PgdA/CDA1 family)
MRRFHDNLIRAGLDALYYSGVHHLMAPAAAGRGLIFALHRVRPDPGGAFAPNHALEVTPDFLRAVLEELRERRIDIVDLDEAMERVSADDPNRFAVFTFDDGYADSIDILSLFQSFEAPFTVFITSGLIDGDADIWWLVLEDAIARQERVQVEIAGQQFDLPSASAAQKQAAWDALYWPVRDLSIEDRRAAMKRLAGGTGRAVEEICSGVAASWETLRKAAQHPLLTLGAHTVHHYPLSRLSPENARFEMAESRRRLEAEIGKEVRHFAYPFGDHDSAGLREFELAKELGFATAVTTRRGPLHKAHAAHLHALPRVSLNGNYQLMRYVGLFLSGAPFVLWNGGRKLDVA